MKKARKEDMEEIRKEIEAEFRIGRFVITIVCIGLLILINY